MSGSNVRDTQYVSQTSITLDNLLSGTTYDFEIRSICSGDTTFAEYFRASTKCADISVLPYTVNFEGPDGATGTSVAVNNLPNCWYNYNVGTNTSYSGYPIVYNSASYAHSGSQAMRFYTTLLSAPMPTSMPSCRWSTLRSIPSTR